MKPYQIFLFICNVFLILLTVALIFPEGGVKLGNSVHLRFTTIDDFIEDDTTSYADISEWITSADTGNENDPVETEQPAAKQDPDGVKENHKKIADSLFRNTIPIEISPYNPEVFYPFFNDLHKLEDTSELIRILHYGDSQIESDRITSYLRRRMQNSFGGSGCGLIPAIPVYHNLTLIRQEHSGNWKRYAGYLKRDTTLNHNRFGALMSFITGQDKNNSSESWLGFSPAGNPGPGKFEQVSLYLTNRIDTLKLDIMMNGSLTETRIISPEPGLLRLNYVFSSAPGKLVFIFKGKSQPEIYGISFDNSRGVAVDNIPLRGSSGLFFSKTDTSFLSEMYRKMNVKMMILQFGGNIVPHQADDYSFYEKYFTRELNIVKKLLPDVPVIVIGPSDMSVKTDDNYITYPGLIKVRDALKNAAFNSGYAFWDMYEAMGGQNSMPAWVNADPPLAVPDYVHFTARGARIIAEKFYNAFIGEYYKWLDL